MGKHGRLVSGFEGLRRSGRCVLEVAFIGRYHSFARRVAYVEDRPTRSAVEYVAAPPSHCGFSAAIPFLAAPVWSAITATVSSKLNHLPDTSDGKGRLFIHTGELAA